MKKAALIITFTVFVLLAFTGCTGKPFVFKEPVEEIESIEIVSAENSLEFTVLKTLSEAERKEFLEQFQLLKFHKIFFGDPVRLHGDSIRITYKSGIYEMICPFSVEYVEDGVIQYRLRYCDDKEAFKELLNRFSE